MREASLLATASSVGLALVVSVFLGLVLGLWLDGRLGTRPWLTVVCLLCGVAAGFKNIWVLSARIENASKAKKASSGGGSGSGSGAGPGFGPAPGPGLGPGRKNGGSEEEKEKSEKI
ncbi:MAG: AtpZ/AtpI family protein [Deltaproteobacteria bacterium]|nr:AtpZ/AtpI family protein [Deltaproteobacteria bacterium]